MRKGKWLLPIIFSLCCFPLSGFSADLVDELTELSIEQLLDLKVTSVARKPQKVSESAAAIFVITGEDILRSGVTSIPEALRMAPGVQVARIDAHKWAITVRGFNGQFANKLLVLIDGRTVYAPSFSGVYWDMQDTLLEDIERIEVIRGPGATLWGANAVNGVVNIITRSAADTQDGLLSMGAGNEEKGFASLRYGTGLGTTGHGRVYAKYREQDSYSKLSTGEDAGDGYRAVQGGFRLDWDQVNSNQITLQGDIYHIDENQFLERQWLLNPPYVQSTADAFESSGANILARWQHQLGADSSTTLQFYYDHNNRDEVVLSQTHDTLDFDFQHSFPVGDGHAVVWGLGYRMLKDDFDHPSFQMSIDPESQTTSLYSAFLQDEIELFPELLQLTLGSKFEHNDFTGFKIQPTLRLLLTPHQNHTLWGALSRAVRTPSRIEYDGRIVTFVAPADPPVVGTVKGNNAMKAEELIAWELGYRVQPGSRLFFDFALFYNEYDKLQSYEQSSGLSSVFDNKLSGESYGFELALEWQIMAWWRLQGTYSYTNFSLHSDTDSTDTVSEQVGEGSSPEQQYSLRSSMNLGANWQLDLWGYHVDRISVASAATLQTGLTVQSYNSLNLRLAWQLHPNLELSLVGQNLLDSEHLEFVGEGFVAPTEVQRSIYGQCRWSF